MEPDKVGLLTLDNIYCQISEEVNNYVIYQEIKTIDINTYEDIINNIYKLRWTKPEDRKNISYTKSTIYYEEYSTLEEAKKRIDELKEFKEIINATLWYKGDYQCDNQE